MVLMQEEGGEDDEEQELEEEGEEDFVGCSMKQVFLWQTPLISLVGLAEEEGEDSFQKQLLVLLEVLSSHWMLVGAVSGQ